MSIHVHIVHVLRVQIRLLFSQDWRKEGVILDNFYYFLQSIYTEGKKFSNIL